jgi:hypothetical protein
MIPLESDDEPTGIDETVVLEEPAAVSAAAAAASAGTACLKGMNAVMYRLPLHTPAPKQTRLRLNGPPGCLRSIV